MPIYTKAGDKGKTRVVNPKTQKLQSIEKSSSQIYAIGAVDEINSYIGIVQLYVKDKKTIEVLKQIQRTLFIIGAKLAGAKIVLKENAVKILEEEIDTMQEEIPPIGHFILPGGTESGAHIHYARTVCRRAERQLVQYTKEKKVEETILQFINRLSDYLFVLARFENYNEKVEEERWPE
jgi:cob(I)alamin adenosyltransferase